MEPIRSSWGVMALSIVPTLKRREEDVPRNAKQGVGGEHNPSEGSRHWQEARGSEMTKGSLSIVCASCAAVSDSTVTPSNCNAQGKELWAVCLCIRCCRSEQWEESIVNQACSISSGCDEAPGRPDSRRASFALGVRGTSPVEDVLSWYGFCPMGDFNSTDGKSFILHGDCVYGLSSDSATSACCNLQSQFAGLLPVPCFHFLSLQMPFPA